MQRNGNARGHAAYDAALDALAPAGLRTTQYAILEDLHRPADAPPIAALQFVEVAARAQRPTARPAQDALKGLAPVLRRRKACGTGQFPIWIEPSASLPDSTFR